MTALVLLAAMALAQDLPSLEKIQDSLRVSEPVLAVETAPVQAPGRLTLHFYSSYSGLNWESPRSLTKSAVGNAAVDMIKRQGIALGHATVEVSCPAEGDIPARSLLTGMTQADLGEAPRLLLKEKRGMGILFHNFAGKLEDAKCVADRLECRAGKGKASFIGYEISPAQCRRLLKYADEFVERGGDDHYGLPNRPLEGEGAGCSAFAVSFLEVAGLLTDEQKKAWTRTLLVPEKYIGTEDRKVRLRSLLFKKSRWAEPGEPHKEVTFYEPEAMHAWVQQKAAARGEGYAVGSMGESVGILIDAKAAPVPDAPIWRKP
jgi:hypothetical protein